MPSPLDFLIPSWEKKQREVPRTTPNDFDSVVERLGITQEDVAEFMQKTGEADTNKALAALVFTKAQSPQLPKNPRVLDQSNMDYDNSGILAEMASGGIGGAISGSPAGPAGQVIGGTAGAMIPFLHRKMTDTPGEINSYDRILDMAAPLGAKGISLINKLGPVGKGAVNAVADAGMNYVTGKLNQFAGKEDSPVFRAGVSGALSGALGIPAARQASRQAANMDLKDEVTKLAAYPGAANKPIDPLMVQDAIAGKIDKTRFPDKNFLAPTEVVKKLVKQNPEQFYDYVLDPVTKSQTVEELKKGTPEFAKRLKSLKTLTDGSPEEASKGLRTSFFNSLAMTKDGGKLANPDSFAARLRALGPEVTNTIFGDPKSYERLSSLADAASVAGTTGRFIVKVGEGAISIIPKPISGTVGKMTPLDADRSLTGLAGIAGKALPMSAFFGPIPGGAVGMYEGYKFTIDKLLGGKEKKTLDLLTKGLANSGIDAVSNKFTEWLEENASETFKF